MPTVTQIARTDRGIATNDMSTYRIRLSIADRIALLDPNQNPATVMFQQYSKIAIGSTKRSWLADELRPEVDTINGACTTTTVTEITVDNISYFAPGDLWRHYTSGEVLYVSGTAAGSIIEIDRNVGTATSGEPGYPVAMLDGDYLEFIGNTLSEGTTSPVALHTEEVQYDNYTQIQRTVLHLTNTEIAMLMHGEQALPYDVRKKGIEHGRKIERQHIFGAKPYNDTTEDKRASGGLFWWIKKYAGSGRVATATTLTEDAFLTWVRHVFRYGGSRKVLFAPPVMLEALSRWAGAHLQMKSTEKMFGVDVQKWITPHGMVPIVNHKMLEGPAEGGGTYNHAFLVDLDDITYCYVKGRDTAFLTGREQPDADAKRQEYLTESTLQVKNPKYHGYFYGFTRFAA